ncbi:hypothetical protein SAMN04488505_11199 [Chitinophaga rupis]|uniref:DUF4890 domain-containing protein n=1 Tax=Chitinophaga rupis TaxID=573321 RepID=A0A1H8HLJ2_9BACT|nr:hypothetical protein [Chitinophaga rupis]SEN57019.1 hypothetical protein SAMN04488505_11199 [Chitinophaga rupis]
MKRIIFASAFIACMAISYMSNAQTATPRVTQRQVNQQKRIAGGVKSGELTARETKHLETREAKLQQNKKEAKADGVVTGQERRQLKREENRNSRAIKRQKHDAQQQQR